jgi:hypothetical protein
MRLRSHGQATRGSYRACQGYAHSHNVELLGNGALAFLCHFQVQIQWAINVVRS